MEAVEMLGTDRESNSGFSLLPLVPFEGKIQGNTFLHLTNLYW